MPGGNRAALGNAVFDQNLYLPSVTYPTMAANANATNTISVPGVLVGDVLSVNMNAPPAHLFLDNVYVSASGVITALWSTDATGISTGTVGVLLEVMRPENGSLGLSALPSTLT